MTDEEQATKRLERIERRLVLVTQERDEARALLRRARFTLGMFSQEHPVVRAINEFLAAIDAREGASGPAQGARRLAVVK